MSDVKGQIVVTEVLDADGYETGLQVYVTVFFEDEIDKSYGADADGNRGVLSVERVIHDVFVCHKDLLRLTTSQLAQVRADAALKVLHAA